MISIPNIRKARKTTDKRTQKMSGEYLGIDRTSSIEFEPRTLNFNQMEFAREAALYVMNTKSMEEAFQIFTQGLEPVTVAEAWDDEEEEGLGIILGEEEDYGEYECSRLPPSTIQRYPSQRFRDVLTAPS